MTKGPVRRAALLLGAVAALLWPLTFASAQGVADFYRDKTITIMLGHPPGGSYDFYARLAADYLKKHLPGQPHILVQHRPGGGGVVAAAYFYANAPRDGTMIALFPETIAHTQILDPRIGRWKMQEMTYIGSFAPVNTAFVIRKGAPAQTIDELRTTETVMACTGASSQGYQYGMLLKTLAGFKFKIVCGYPGSSEVQLAMKRGEADITSSSWNSIRITQRDEIKSGNLKLLIQAGLRRNAELSHVPLMQELVNDQEAKRIVEFASAGAAIGRALLAPPDVPARCATHSMPWSRTRNSSPRPRNAASKSMRHQARRCRRLATRSSMPRPN
jgi:tripartite-type tricarboxylate transporter receptor subunit TctC